MEYYDFMAPDSEKYCKGISVKCEPKKRREKVKVCIAKKCLN